MTRAQLPSSTVHYDQSISTDSWTESAHWTVIAVSPDGSLAEAPMDPVPNPGAYGRVLDNAHAADFATFGYRAETGRNGDEQSTRDELRWTWDKTAKRYVVRSRTTQVPKKKAPPKKH